MYRYFTLLLLTCFTLSLSKVWAQPNKRLITELDTIYKNDQLYRRIKDAPPAEDRENMRKQRVLDIANLAKVEKIFTEYGYPGKSLVGPDHQSVAFMVIQHSDDDAQEKYLPLITQAAEKGELRASSLAILIDRVRMNRGEKQIYGSQMRETKDGIKIYPIEDEANVNIRRAKIGLPTMETYYKYWKIPYKVPTATYQNPPEMYYVPGSHEESTVEAIGGDKSIFSRLRYPAKAKEANITGAVTLEFTVDTAGITKDFTIVKGLGYGCDEEAIEVIKATKYVNKTGEEKYLRMVFPFPYQPKKK